MIHDEMQVLYIGGTGYETKIPARRVRASDRTRRDLRNVRAVMPGLVIEVLISPGQPVREGTPLVVVEAMKMQNGIRAAADGVVTNVHVSPGVQVVKDQLLVEIEPRARPSS